jgi:cullin-associated NEDD8-dissociated protein 1
MLSVDKDFRFMATNDLMVELQKDSIKLDDETERRITKSLLKLLDDKNGEVQNLAVKCLAPLIAKAKPQQVKSFCKC